MVSDEARSLLLAPSEHLSRLRELMGLSCVSEVYSQFVRLSSTKDREVAALLANEFQRDRPRILSELIGNAAASSTPRSTVHRGDWLFAEQKITFAMNAVLWSLMVDANHFNVAGGWESTLRRLCGDLGIEEQLVDAALCTPDLRGRVDRVIDLLVSVVNCLRSQGEVPEFDGEAELFAFQRGPEKLHFWPPNLPSDEEKSCDLNRLVEALRDLPGFKGALLVGSFASPFKRDRFSDIDLHCYCAELPDSDARSSLIKKLDPPNGSDSITCFHSIGMPSMGVHMSYVSSGAQVRYFDRLVDTGQELPLVTFTNAAFATSAYYLTNGEILADPEGEVAAYRHRALEYPAALERAVIARWTPIWLHHAEDFQVARGHDRLKSCSALAVCTEAAIRILMARNHRYCNPIEPKWIPIELSHLVKEGRQDLRGIDLLPDGRETEHHRFRKLQQIMDMP